jgi:hypothetical protein
MNNLVYNSDSFVAADHEPSVEELDDYIAGYTELAQQPHALH